MYFPYSSWGIQQHKTPNPSESFCKSATIFVYYQFESECETYLIVAIAAM